MIPLCGASARQTVVFQQGLNDYAGMIDTRLRERDEQSGEYTGSLSPDGGNNTYGDADYALLYYRFDNLFGDGPGQIPPGSLILKAVLTVTTTVSSNAQTGGFFTVAALNEPLAEPEDGTIFSAYFNARGYGGPDFADGHTSRPVTSFRSPWNPVQRIDQGEQAFVDLTEIVQFWAGETPEEPRNHGLIITPVNGTDGWNIHSSGSGDLEARPKLEVTYLTPEEAAAQRANTLTFRQGAPLDADDMVFYESTVSAKLQDPTYRGGEAESLDGSVLNLSYLDGFNTTDSSDDQMMIQFDRIFGEEPGQIKVTPLLVIERAVLKLTTGPSGNAYSPGPANVHRVLVPWYSRDEAGAYTFMKWSDFKAPDDAETPTGPTVENGALAPLTESLYGMGFNQKNGADVTEIVRAWVAGAPNYGFNVRLGTADGWEVYWPGAPMEDARPELVVTYRYLPDADGDLMPDDWEVANGTNPAAPDADGDPDGDTLSNLTEYRLGTNPNAKDTDGDGLDDNVEDGGGVWVSASKTGTNPLLADTDGDGLSDGLENPTLPHTGATQPGSDPNKEDSDGDGWPDGAEVAAGSNPANAGQITSYAWTTVMKENFDDDSTASVYGFIGAGSFFPEVMDSEEPSNGLALRLTNLTTNSNTAVTWDHVDTTAIAARLTFDYRLSEDTTGEAADGFGIGLFRVEAYGETGEVNPGASPREWEDPRAGGGFSNGVVFGFDIYGGAAEGNNIRVSGPDAPGEVLTNVVAPFPLNNGTFNRVIITAVGSGSSTLFSMTIVENVNGEAPVERAIFNNLRVAGFDITREKVRLIAGGRTGTSTARLDLDNVKLETAAAATPEEPETVPAITNVALETTENGGLALKVTWTSEPGRTYTLERSTDLKEWIPVMDNLPAATGASQTSWSVPLGSSAPDKVFYRVKPGSDS